MKFLAKLAFLPLAAALVTAPPAASQDKSGGKPKLRDESRIWILRGLIAEYGMVLKPLPRGNKGFPLHSSGKIDEQELSQRLTMGTALRPGDLAQITAVKFEKDKIIFEINGGGKSKRKWYDNVQIGMGSPNTRVGGQTPVPVPAGSSIELLFDRPVPDITVDELKQMLSPVLDFSRRSPAVVYTESLPKEIQEAIKDHKATVGMDRDMVLAALGRPDRKMRETHKGVETEDWIYGTVPAKVTIVTFEGDKVTEVKELTPGVADPGVKTGETPPANPLPPTIKQ
jgi:hypothetical protein